jgi:hypothetical protein
VLGVLAEVPSDPLPETIVEPSRATNRPWKLEAVLVPPFAAVRVNVLVPTFTRALPVLFAVIAVAIVIGVLLKPTATVDAYPVPP